ncbi:MAG TPA: hypothetical protein VFI53_21230 [Myxococcaceae bacterium]|nr:hypothetical protein [Myxococcaceae bacterium]
MTTQTIVHTAPTTMQEAPTAPRVTWLLDRVVRFHWPHPRSIDSALARAIDEAFQSFARENRS